MQDVFKKHWIILPVLVYFWFVSGAFLVTTPPFEAPDEVAHFLYADHIVRTGELPVMQGYDAAWSSGQLASHHPPLYYFLLSLTMPLTERDDLADYKITNPFNSVGTATYNNANAYLHRIVRTGDTHIAFYIGRILSVLITSGTLVLAYSIMLIIIDNRAVSALTALLTASIPTFVFIGMSVNNDVLATFIFSSGILWLVQFIKEPDTSTKNSVLLGVILAGLALTKLNTVVFYGIAYATIGLIFVSRRISIPEFLKTTIPSGLTASVLAGWWYLRNWQLYDDPLALAATRQIWSRGEPPSEISAILSEAKGVWDSFWFMLGSFNIRAHDIVYTYAAIAVLLAVIGLIFYWRRNPKQRSYLILFLGIIVAMVVGLVVTTRQINVSQGRILFPSIVAVAGLLVLGWYSLLGHHLFWLPLLPFILVMFVTPNLYLQPSYPQPVVVETVPDSTFPLNVFVDGLELVAYEYQPEYLDNQHKVMTVDLYIRGQHQDNPIIFLKLLDPVTSVPVGGVDTYPAMALTNDFSADTLYRVQTRFAVDDARITGFFSREMQLRAGFRESAENDNIYAMQDTNGQSIDTLLLPAPSFINPDYLPDIEYTQTNIQFGENIALRGYTISDHTAQVGDVIAITTNWFATGSPSQDWVITIGLLDSDGILVTQADGDPIYFPTSEWQRGLWHTDTRLLEIPETLEVGEYQMYIALYDRDTFDRLPVSSTNANIYMFIEPVVITD